MQLLFVAVFLAFVFTAVLRPAVEFLARWVPRGLATAFALLGGIVFFLGLLTYVGYSIANQWADLTEQFSDGIGQITDFLENGLAAVQHHQRADRRVDQQRSEVGAGARR